MVQRIFSISIAFLCSCLILTLLLTSSNTMVYILNTFKNMLQKIFLFTVILFFTLGSWFAYVPTDDLQDQMDSVVVQIENIIEIKGEAYRQNFISAIKWYQIKYSDSDRIIYVLEYVLTAINIRVSHPNIILIIADDMWLDAMPWYEQGNIKPTMPNIESMMLDGISYNNLWSAPVCTPTRATIMTWKYGYHTNMLAVDDTLDTNEVGLQSYLDENTNNAYAHAVIGKWHIGNATGHPEDMGVGYYAGMQWWGTKSYYNWKLTENKQTTTSSEYITSKFTDLAIDWVGEQEKPWFLWLAYTAPHTPFHLPPSGLHSQWDLPDDEESISWNPIPYYMAALEAMDSEIGRLLASIPEDELKNTTIIFIGDNGTPGQVVQSPYSKQKAKWSLYQWGVNVPMVVSWYGVERGWETDDALINTTDLYATIAQIWGVNISEIHDSYSFMDSFVWEDTGERDYTYSEVWDSRGAGYTIRNERYKLIVLDNGSEKMYDLVTDPYETTNLLNTTLTDFQEQAKQELEDYIRQIQK